MKSLNNSNHSSNRMVKTSAFLKIGITLFLLLLVNHLIQAQTNETASAKQPNVFVFLVDDMGLMDTSVPFLTDEKGEAKTYPFNKYYETPGIEKLATRGIRFETFYANSVCSPSRASLMTGQSSARHHITQWINPEKKNEGPKEWKWRGLSASAITLPRLLQANGYLTIHVGKAHFGPVGSEGENPLNLGFDVNVAGSSIGRPDDYFGQNNFGKGLRHVKDLEAYHGTDTHLSDALTKEMCKSIDKAVEQWKPFYAYMAHYAVHSPFQEDPRFADQYSDELGEKMPAFGSLVAGMDKSLVDILQHLEETGQAENTFVIFMGDNGSDAPVKAPDYSIVSSAPLRGKKGTSYEGGTRVPFIAAWADINPENKLQQKFPVAKNAISTNTFATIEDIMPTVLALTETSVPQDYVMDGINILPALAAANTPTGRNHFLMHFPHQHRSNNFTTYREGNWKLTCHYSNDVSEAYELFNLEQDFTESNNLAESNPEQLSYMIKQMQVKLNDAGAQFMAREFYVDSENGNDSNSGRSPELAWASLEKVNQTIFYPNDKILFKAGSSWTGQLEPKGSGSAEAVIEINKYGEGKNPAIHGQGEKQHTLLLHNVEYWEVRNLEIANTGKEPKAGRRGVIVSARDFGDCHHIVLDSLEIHHVNGSLVKSEGGGSAIIWQNSGDSIKTRFIDLQITNCYLHHCERNGINSRGYSNRKNWHPSLWVVIRNNLLEQIPGDGIVPIGTDGTLIEHNVMRDCPDILPFGDAAAGIWPWSADNTIIQFNEVAGHKAKWDGQGFDSDWNCQNSIIQYNYSHDNYGGFLLVCNNGKNYNTSSNIGTTNTIVRYNVSINDGIRPYKTQNGRWFAPTMHISGPVESTYLYNNVFVIPEKPTKDIDRTIVEMDNWGGPRPQDTWFANNIFYVNEIADFHFEGDEGTRFTNNCFYGEFENLPKDPAAIFKDPEFVDFSARGDGFEVLKNFMLTKSSPLRDRGIAIPNNVDKDLFGNKMEGKPEIGVHEF